MKNSKLKLLEESLTVLSLSYDEQKQILPSFVENPMADIVEDFINAFYLVPQLLDENLIDDNTLKLLVYCYVRVQTNYLNEDWVSKEAFKNHQVWDLARIYARKALDKLKNS